MTGYLSSNVFDYKGNSTYSESDDSNSNHCCCNAVT